jgi:hypothetical protein
MTINNLCLPGLGSTAVKATKARRLDAPCEKVKWNSARWPIEVSIDSEPGEIKVENVFRAGKNFLLIAATV